MRRFLFSVSFALLLAAGVAAADFDAQCMLRYQKLERHVCGQCHLNVLELLEQLPAGTDLSNTFVLYLKPPWVRRLKAYAVNESWIFHVVLKREGKILDPDFAKDASTEWKKYFTEMYRLNEFPNNDFELIVIPASDYLTQMGRVDQRHILVDHEYYLNKEGYGRYPKVQASELLSGKSMPAPAADSFRPPEMLRLIEDSRNIEWRDGDWTLRMAEGKITAFFRGEEAEDAARSKRFFEEIESRSRSHERFKRSLHHYWASGGKRP